MATWNRIGTDVSGINRIDEVLKAVELDYEVVKSPIYYNYGGRKVKIDNQVATVRKTDGHQYGIVSESYQVCQNRDAFDFVNYISEDIEFVKAGETHNGLVYIIAKLPSVNILDDDFDPYVIFQNGHNGGISLRAAICPLRIVCENQFAVAFKGASGSINLRHTPTLENKLAEGKEILFSSAEFMKTLDKTANDLVKKKVNDLTVEKILSKMFKVDEKSSIRATNRAMEDRLRFLDAYDHNDNQNFKNTAWGLVNAYSRFVTHSTPNRISENWDENRFMHVTFSTGIMNNFIDMVREVA